jgi:hypothetical protein
VLRCGEQTTAEGVLLAEMGKTEKDHAAAAAEAAALVRREANARLRGLGEVFDVVLDQVPTRAMYCRAG